MTFVLFFFMKWFDVGAAADVPWAWAFLCLAYDELTWALFWSRMRKELTTEQEGK